MRKMRDRILPLLLSILCMVAVLLMQASAADAIDLKHDVTLTVSCQWDEFPLSGATFDVYYAADIDENAAFTLAGDFQNYPVTLGNLAEDTWQPLAETLTAYAVRDKLEPLDSGETGEDGTVSFPTANGSLKPGLYLVVGHTVIVDGHSVKAAPFLVSLPRLDSETDCWTYDVTAEPKQESEDLAPNPPDDETVQRKVLKVWKNDVESQRPTEIVVDLLKNGEVYDTVTLSEENGWSYNWDKLPRYNADGTRAEWTMTEQTVEDYTVLIEKNGITFTVTNTYAPKEATDGTVKRTITKVWDDKGYESRRPSSVQVTLLQNGAAYDTITLNEENSWQHTWDELPKCDADGKEYTWTIQETAVSGYTASVQPKEDIFVLTNQIEGQKLPQTGMLWWPVPLLAAAGVCFLIIGALGRKKQNHDET